MKTKVVSRYHLSLDCYGRKTVITGIRPYGFQNIVMEYQQISTYFKTTLLKIMSTVSKVKYNLKWRKPTSCYVLLKTF